MLIERNEPRFWGSYKGRIIKSISIDGARTWDDILELTGLNPRAINTVLSELFDLKAIYKTNDNEYRVAKDLYIEYKTYFSNLEGNFSSSLKVKKEDQQNIVREFQDWMSLKKASLTDNHTFLEGGKLDDLTRHLIENVRTELLVVNPFIDKSNLVNTMKNRSQKGIIIKVLTKPPELKEKTEFVDNLQEYKIDVSVNKSIHAKIMVFDRGVAIISSMNLFAFSLGGGSWEAGIATCSEDVVSEVLNGITLKFDEKETSSWKANRDG
jgi:hypothetical protein